MTAVRGGDAHEFETAHPVGFPASAGCGLAGRSPEAEA